MGAFKIGGLRFMAKYSDIFQGASEDMDMHIMYSDAAIEALKGPATIFLKDGEKHVGSAVIPATREQLDSYKKRYSDAVIMTTVKRGQIDQIRHERFSRGAAPAPEPGN